MYHFFSYPRIALNFVQYRIPNGNLDLGIIIEVDWYAIENDLFFLPSLHYFT